MTLFHDRASFERSCRLHGIVDLAYDDQAGEYINPHTQKAYKVWDSLAQSSHAQGGPIAWVLRRRGKHQGISVTRPYSNTTPEEWAKREAMGWEQPLMLWPSLPRVSASATACLMERVRQQTAKGYSPELDKRYVDGELVYAALAYAGQALPGVPLGLEALWPWEGAPMKSDEPGRAIEKAVALLIAEHERIRAMGSQAQQTAAEAV